MQALMKLNKKQTTMKETTKKNVLQKEKIWKCTKNLCRNASLFQAKVDVSRSEGIYGPLKGLFEQQAAPDLEMETLEYLEFVNLFKELMEKWIQDPKERLHRLLKCTKGEAHNLMKHYLKGPTCTGCTNFFKLGVSPCKVEQLL